ncbi:MAG: lytic murein transglycosylase [Proteobacteria bacterium]|nr:lytic murein transglycosylase [Pseudomonadota bacterium]
MKCLIRFFAFVCVLAMHLVLVNPIFGKDVHPTVSNLVDRLHIDGLDEQYLQDLFSRPDLKLMPQAIAKSLMRKEANLNYAQFLEKYSVDRTISYLKTHRKSLEKMEGHFRVSAPVVVAILSVETSCGRYMGKFETVNILVTQTLSLEPVIYRQIYDYIPAKEKSNLTPQRVRKRLEQKSARAYAELKALLIYSKDHGVDPFLVKGSIEGAIGLPQFLPSNIKRYGFDGNGDGKIDLFQHEDAITSVASYLQAHKWREDYTYRQKKKIIRNYNQSDYYANTVLKLAELLANHWP